MSHSHGAVCLCVAEHRPAPLDGEFHHVWPLGMGGPDVEENLTFLCPTAHTNVHAILRLHVKADRVLTWTEVGARFEEPVSRYAYSLACLGFRRWKARSLVA